MANLERRTLPERFDCLHLRVEADWLTWCCSDGVRNKGGWLAAMRSEPDAGAANGLCPDGSKPNAACYRNVGQVTKWLLHARGVMRGHTVFVATGASRETLAPLADAFDVRMHARDPARKHAFMDYTAAAVQKLVCTLADRFYGKSGSSFTADILRMRGRKMRRMSWLY